MKTYFIYICLIAYSSCSVQKNFDKKYVTKESMQLAKVRTLQASSNQVNKITCSSLCLRDSGEDCNAFRVNSKNECELIENPEQLQEHNSGCLDGTESSIWTVKDLKPPIRDEYVMVVGGIDEPYTEILNLGCPAFQCKNQVLPTIRPTEWASGGVIDKTPVICGGQQLPYDEDRDNTKYSECFKLEDQDWKPLSNTLSKQRMASGAGNIVINDQYVLVSGGIVHHQEDGTIKLQELVPLNGNIISSSLQSTATAAHCIIQLNESSILITGGNNSHAKTMFQNFDTMEQVAGPDLKIGRRLHACGKIKINGETILVVVGGKKRDDKDLKSTEFLNLDSDNPIWEVGKLSTM